MALSGVNYDSASFPKARKIQGQEGSHHVGEARPDSLDPEVKQRLGAGEKGQAWGQGESTFTGPFQRVEE